MACVGTITSTLALLAGLVLSNAQDCSSAAAACVADGTCGSCLAGYNEAYDGCFVGQLTDCDEITEAICCATPSGCKENEPFAVFTECGNTAYSCGYIDVRDCSAGDLTTSFSDEIATTCASEAAACWADFSCSACFDVVTAEYQTCWAELSYSGETFTCSETFEIVCCNIAEGNDCENNALLGAYYDCAWEVTGCDLDIADCLDGGVSTDDNNSLFKNDDGGGGSTNYDTSLVEDDDGDASTNDDTSLVEDDDGGALTNDDIEEQEDTNIPPSPSPVEDEEDDDTDNTSITNASSATPSAVVGGATATGAALLLIAAVPNLARHLL